LSIGKKGWSENKKNNKFLKSHLALMVDYCRSFTFSLISAKILDIDVYPLEKEIKKFI